MPPARPATRCLVHALFLVAFGLLVLGTGGGVAPPAAIPASGVGGDVPSSQYDTVTDAPGENTSLLTRAELYATVVDEGTNETTAGLYFVAGDGSWYHAHQNGTVGAPAPDGAVVPNIADETVDIPPSGRPVYVWKVTRDGCGTTVYDASDGRTISAFPIPGCDVPSPPTTAPSPPTGEHGTRSTERDETPATGTTPGFGTGVSLVALFVVAVVILWR